MQSPSAISDGSAVGVPVVMNEHERATSRFPTRSGWVMSIPPSITPTVTPLPVANAYEAGPTPIARMSHWHDDSGSDVFPAPYAAVHAAAAAALSKRTADTGVAGTTMVADTA